MAIQHEKPFESEICDWLAEHGWSYRDTPPYDELYDRATGLCLLDLYGWLYDTQPEQLAKLAKTRSAGGQGAPVDGVLGKEFAPAAARIRDRIVKLLATDPMAGGGTLNVLKNPVDVTPARFSLFRPGQPLP
jgi:type I restriction enzyme R subunit